MSGTKLFSESTGKDAFALQQLKDIFFAKPDLKLLKYFLTFLNWRLREYNDEIVLEGKRNGTWVAIDKMKLNNLQNTIYADGEYILTKKTKESDAVWKLSADFWTDYIHFVIDGWGSTITTGVKGFVSIPFDCTITGWILLADQTGAIVVDVWKDTYANFPPTNADSITGSEVPTIPGADHAQDLSLTTWTTAVTAGDILGFNVDSVSTVERVELILVIQRK